MTITFQKNDESATEYVVQRRLSTDNDSLFATTQGYFATTSSVFYDTSVVSPKNYYYRIFGRNAYESTDTSYKGYYAYILEKPLDLNLAPQPPQRSVRLDWTNTSNAEIGFKVFRKLSTAGSFTKIADLPVNSLNYTDVDTVSSLVLGSTYTYYVQAFNMKHVASSESLNVTISYNTPVIHISPTNLTFTNAGIGNPQTINVTANNTYGTAALIITTITSNHSRFSCALALPCNSL